MDTNKLTTIFGGVYGIDQLQQAAIKLVQQPSVENGFHVLTALGIMAWAYFTNK